MLGKKATESVVREIGRNTKRKLSRGENSHCTGRPARRVEHCSHLSEGINNNLYYKWSKDFLEASKKRLLGDVVRENNSEEVGELKQENEQLKQLVAELSLKNRVLKKSLSGLE